MVGSHWEPVQGEPTSGPRARFWLAVEVGSTDLGGVVEVVELDPPHELAWTNVSGIDNRGRWILRDRRREDRGDPALQLPGAGRSAGPDRQPAQRSRSIRRDVRRSLAALKEIVEGGPDMILFPLAHAGHILADAAIFGVPVGSVLADDLGAQPLGAEGRVAPR